MSIKPFRLVSINIAMFGIFLGGASMVVAADALADQSDSILQSRFLLDQDVRTFPTPDQSCRRCEQGGWSSSSRPTLFQWSATSADSGTNKLSEPLVTDRPDFTEASSTVGLGISQIEFGYTYTHDSQDGTSVTSHSLGEPLLRHGVLTDWIELRIALFPVIQRTKTAAASNTTVGTEDLYLGLKLALTPQQAFLPEMAIIPQMTVPTGSNAFTNDEVLPGVNWVYSWEINDCLSTGGSTQLNRTLDEISGDTFTLWAQSWTVGYSLTDRLGAYTEWFAFFPQSSETEQVKHFANTGLTWLINDDVQFDVRAGWGLNSAADDFFAGTGLSIRFR